MDIPFVTLRHLICPLVFKNSFMAVVYWRGTLGQNLTCLGIFLAFCLMMEMASRLEKVQIRKWLLAASLPLLASKTAMGVALASSSVFRSMGDKILDINMSLGCMFIVLGVFTRFLKTSIFEDLSSSLCQNY